MLLTRRQMIAAAAAALSSGTVPGLTSRTVLAQQSGKVVHLILPNAVGSGVDALARTAQPALAKALDAPVVVENQPGAGGILGLQALARSVPDGTALSIVSNNVVIFPSVLKSVPFRMPDDFTPIALLGSTPIVLAVNPNNVPARNSKEFIELLRGNPDKFNYGSGGNGTILHLACEMFLAEAGVTAKHVPYKGVGPMVSDLIGGQIDFATAALPSLQAHIASGKLRAIGVCTPERVAGAPDIPTFVEQGLPGYVMEAWFAMLGPKGMAAADVKRVHDAIITAFSDPKVKEVMARQGNTIKISTPEEAAATFQSELVKYARIVKKAGIEPT